jgi:hypothetical protein
VAIGEIPEVVVYRNPAGTFTRSVTAGYIISILIMLILRAKQSAAVPYYGIGVFMPIMVMGLAIRKHILQKYTGRVRKWGSLGALFAAILAGIVFVGQIVGKWTEGGWVVLITFSILVLAANTLLISPIGYRDPKQIHRIVREKARVQGSMGSIVEWQSLKMQEYRYSMLVFITRFFEILGVRRPLRFEPPVAAGTDAPSLLAQYLDKEEEPKVGGKPKETAPGDDPSKLP